MSEHTSCPDCGRQWPTISEQAVAVELAGHCIACHYQKNTTLAAGIWEQIVPVSQSRRSTLVAGAFHAFLESIQDEQTWALLGGGG